jgi:uncharacterized protein (TIGR01732 family)
MKSFYKLGHCLKKWLKCPTIIFFSTYFVITKRKEVFEMADGVGYGGGFALIVVLFILLIIVGTAYIGGGFYY